MPVRQDCRHYLRRSTPAGDALERCRISVNEEHPFACPEGCLFFEARALSSAGWAQPSGEPMSNTASGLHNLPDPKGPARSPKNGSKGSRRGKGKRGS